jgi:dsRNA-specific ribonuclease
VPDILGLTASPVMRSDPNSVNEIEQTMDAICRTPKRHRAELLLQVKLPVLSEVPFRALTIKEKHASNVPLTKSLGRVYANLKIGDDPYVIRLRRDKSERSQRKLDKVYLNHKTPCSDELKTFHSTALKMWEELGVWAAEFYILDVLAKYDKVARGSEEYLESWDAGPAEKEYISKLLKQVDTTGTTNPLQRSEFDISNKFSKLIDIMLAQDPSVFRGIIFVQERAVVSVLARLLSVHPQTRNLFKIGTMVGTSTNEYRDGNIAEFVTLGSQGDALADFRAGKLNLLVATSVLEEGIDVPACNTVICFQKPANLKSFVQRRGRARQRDSKLIILHEANDSKVTDWRQLEENMRQMYADDQRVLQELAILEEEEYHDGRFFFVESTGALLNLDNAVSHLYHFCATLPAKAYVDLRPDFICTEVDANRQRARVILPLSVDAAVRFASSKDTWTSEKNAIKDAAFEAYLGLYRAGLVNDNLLPLLRHGIDVTELTSTRIETRASLMEVNEQMVPWHKALKILKEDTPNTMTHVVVLSISGVEADTKSWSMFATLPSPLPRSEDFILYWNRATEFIASTGGSTDSGFNKELQSSSLRDTWTLLDAAFGHRFLIQRKDFVMMFALFANNSIKTLAKTEAKNYSFPQDPSSCPLVHDMSDPLVRYVYKAILPCKPPYKDIQHPYEGYETASDGPYLSLQRLSKRADFLHKVTWDGKSLTRKPHAYVLPVSRCFIEGIPFQHIQLALFIPSFIHQMSISLLAQDLSSTILAPLQLTNLSQIVTAITSSQADSTNNYQRLEFFGDSILKLCTSIQITTEYPLWHEGYLSAKKDRLVANSRLSRACIELGLDKYIITKKFTGAKWRPLYTEDYMSPQPEAKRTLSSKVLADVIESLIGLVTTQGGIPAALHALQIFLPELSWLPLEDRQSTLFTSAPSTILPPPLVPLQSLLAYTFNKPALLIEALTHASYIPDLGSPSSSLERLEFLGDSILDKIIVQEMYNHIPELTHFQMHILRTACVNADFLAFTCMELSTAMEITSIDPKTRKPITKNVETPLYRFVRHASPSLAANMQATAKRHTLLRANIKEALETGTHFPWALLARLEAQKWYSDIIESILGALWVDSGSFDVCKDFMEKLGILKFLRRCLEDVTPKGQVEKGKAEGVFDLGLSLGVHCWHPKEELGVLVGNQTVKYTVWNTTSPPQPPTATTSSASTQQPTTFSPSSASSDTIKGPYACTISLNNTPLLTCKNGVNKLEIMTRTAERAVRILVERRQRGEEMVVDRDIGKEDDDNSGDGREKENEMDGIDRMDVEELEAGIDEMDRMEGIEIHK